MIMCCKAQVEQLEGPAAQIDGADFFWAEPPKPKVSRILFMSQTGQVFQCSQRAQPRCNCYLCPIVIECKSSLPTGGSKGDEEEEAGLAPEAGSEGQRGHRARGTAAGRGRQAQQGDSSVMALHRRLDLLQPCVLWGAVQCQVQIMAQVLPSANNGTGSRTLWRVVAAGIRRR
jgi:hypothetical protein